MSRRFSNASAFLLLAACSPDTARVSTLSAATVSPNAAYDSTRARRVLVDSLSIDFSEGSVSRDGRFLSGLDAATGNLVVREVKAGRQRMLTTSGNWAKGDNALASHISPDGQHVAFVWSFGSPSYAFDARVIRMDGTGERVLRSGKTFLSTILGDWTPDSKHIVVSTTGDDGNHQIALLSASDGSIHIIKSLAWRMPGALKVSPDGRRVAYAVDVERGSNARDIHVLELDGSRETRLTGDRERKDVLGWSEDGRTVYYQTRKDDAATIWRIPATNGAATGAAPQMVRSDIWGMQAIGFSKGGLYYAVTTRRAAVRLLAIDFDVGRMTTPPSVLVAGEDVQQAGRVAWSPDGRRLAYIKATPSSAAGRTALVLREVRSGAEQQVQLPLVGTGVLEWDADGRSITVAGYDRGTRARYRVDLATGKQALIDRLVEYGEIPEPSPDGRLEYITRSDSASDSMLVIARQAGTREEHVLFRERRIWRVLLSPDGKHLGVVGVPTPDARSTYIAIIPTAGGSARVVHSASRPRRLGFQINWTPDSRFLVFVEQEIGTDVSEFWKAAPTADSAQHVATLKGDAPSYARMSPDGHHVAYTSLAGPNVRELWVMETVPNAQRTAASRP